jgi:hypothetical protein
MELFIPSVLVLLLAAAVVFFVFPRFGAPTLALISVVLLVFGVYQHMNAFGTEYRLSTWQMSLMSYAPFVMIGGLLIVITFYLLALSPLGGATAPSIPEIPSVAEMPSANTATNVVTEGVNNALKGITNVTGNVAAAVGLGNGNKGNKGNGEGIVNNAVKGVGNAVNNEKNMIFGNNTNNTKTNTKGTRVPGINFPLSQL